MGKQEAPDPYGFPELLVHEPVHSSRLTVESFCFLTFTMMFSFGNQKKSQIIKRFFLFIVSHGFARKIARCRSNFIARPTGSFHRRFKELFHALPPPLIKRRLLIVRRVITRNSQAAERSGDKNAVEIASGALACTLRTHAKRLYARARLDAGRVHRCNEQQRAGLSITLLAPSTNLSYASFFADYDPPWILSDTLRNDKRLPMKCSEFYMLDRDLLDHGKSRTSMVIEQRTPSGTERLGR